MTGWNLPPGCNVNDIPGNRPEDQPLRIPLTTTEVEILRHRLEVPDALVEALSPEENDGIGYHADDVEAAIDDLLCGLGERGLEVLTNEPVAEAVLRDCIEGSTWLAGTISACGGDSECLRVRRVRGLMLNLATKLRDYLGMESSPRVPSC